MPVDVAIFTLSNECNTFTGDRQDRQGFAMYNAIGAPPSLMLERVRPCGFSKYHDVDDRQVQLL